MVGDSVIRARRCAPMVRGSTIGYLTKPTRCSTFVLMEVETLGVARSLAGSVHMRCANGYRLETRSMRKCVYRKQLDLETLVATRGPNFPLWTVGRAADVPSLRKSEGDGGL